MRQTQYEPPDACVNCGEPVGPANFYDDLHDECRDGKSL